MTPAVTSTSPMKSCSRGTVPNDQQSQRPPESVLNKCRRRTFSLRHVANLTRTTIRTRQHVNPPAGKSPNQRLPVSHQVSPFLLFFVPNLALAIPSLGSYCTTQKKREYAGTIRRDCYCSPEAVPHAIFTAQPQRKGMIFDP
jgi:hypothetical protein